MSSQHLCCCTTPCCSHILVAVAYSGVGVTNEAVIEVHVPVVPQLLLPGEVLHRVNLKGVRMEIEK